jgi:hypothetical protein
MKTTAPLLLLLQRATATLSKERWEKYASIPSILSTNPSYYICTVTAKPHLTISLISHTIKAIHTIKISADYAEGHKIQSP